MNITIDEIDPSYYINKVENIIKFGVNYYSKPSHKLVLPETTRSSKWPVLRNKWLKQQPVCQCCDKTTKLEVHHIRPVHLYPELELDETNLITLCENPIMNCHFVVGHCFNWLAWNGNVISDSYEISSSIQHRFFNREGND